jgi:hypothetical protein
MEWSYEITQFLPRKIENESILKYVEYHSDKLEKSILWDVETWIYLHSHILYMMFIYFQLLRISQIKEEEFKYSWIWLANNEKEFRKDNLNPFSFSWINEKTVFRFFRLIGFDDGTISNISECVNHRNDILHATGKHIDDFDVKVNRYISNMENIVWKSQDFLIDVFKNFKDNNEDLFEVWYVVWSQDLEANLYIPYQISDYELSKIVTWEKSWKVIEAIKENIE